jgi:hypothetical protein
MPSRIPCNRAASATFRVLLWFAHNYNTGYSGEVPLRLFGSRTRSGAAALSRAVSRLERRGLLDVHRVNGRAASVGLTWQAKQVLGVNRFRVETVNSGADEEE